MNRWVVWALLLAVYLALSANLEWRNWLVGILLTGGILLLLPVKHTQLRLYHLPAVLWAVFRYLVQLAWETLKSGLEVMYLVLHPSLPIHPAVIKIPPLGESRFGIALSAHSFTVSPGEMVIAIDEEHNLYTHILNIRLDEQGNLAAKYKRFGLLWKIFAAASRQGKLE